MSNPGQPDPSEPYKLRATEYRERYESMRTLEWQVIIQVYAGYAAIAAVFFKLIDQFNHHYAFRIMALIGTLVFFIAAQYLYFRIQERLIVFNETHDYFMKRIPGFSDPSTEPGLAQSSLKHQYFWTYETQSALSLLTVLGLLAYEAVIGYPMPKEQALFWKMLIPAGLTAIAVFIGMALSLRRKRKTIVQRKEAALKAGVGDSKHGQLSAAAERSS